MEADKKYKREKKVKPTYSGPRSTVPCGVKRMRRRQSGERQRGEETLRIV